MHGLPSVARRGARLTVELAVAAIGFIAVFLQIRRFAPSEPQLRAKIASSAVTADSEAPGHECHDDEQNAHIREHTRVVDTSLLHCSPNRLVANLCKRAGGVDHGPVVKHGLQDSAQVLHLVFVLVSAYVRQLLWSVAPLQKPMGSHQGIADHQENHLEDHFLNCRHIIPDRKDEEQGIGFRFLQRHPTKGGPKYGQKDAQDEEPLRPLKLGDPHIREPVERQVHNDKHPTNNGKYHGGLRYLPLRRHGSK
mmetsp:Transcript_82119/g.235933  ORF Transcript_82119/g.235933 Transcript_82119/m.235933 type:complete len:251 (-) Transcript_82119:55-807(-)